MDGAEFNGNKVEYERLLLVGLGGSGIRAVRTALLYGQRPGPGIPPIDEALAESLERRHVVAVGIDTDSDEFKEIQVKPAAFPQAIRVGMDKAALRSYPPIDHLVSIQRNDMDEAIMMAKKMQRHSDENRPPAVGDAYDAAKLISEFLAISERQYDTLLAAGEEVTQGAGQLRSLGRIGFLCGMETIYASLGQALRDIGYNQGGYGLRIALFSSLAGGTGSGMFLDVAIMLRRLLAPKASLSGFFLLPEIFSAASDLDRIWPNCYAALKELSILARPQNVEPIRLNYRMGGENNRVVIQRGDPPIFEDVYLFDDTAMLVDGEVDPDLRRDAEIYAASRAMVDVALALNRRDITSVNKNKQNRLVGHARGSADTRRVYHAARAWPLLPQGTGHLACTLFLVAGKDCILDPLQRLELHERLPVALTGIEQLRTFLLGNWESSSTEEGQYRDVWRQSLEDFLRPVKNMAEGKDDDFLRGMERSIDHEKLLKGLELRLGAEIFGVIKKWIQLIEKEDEESHAKLKADSAVKSSLVFCEIFKKLIVEDALKDVFQFLDVTLHRMQAEKSFLSKEVYNRLRDFRADVEKRARRLDPDEDVSSVASLKDCFVSIEAPDEFYKQRVTFDAYYGDKKEYASKLRKFAAPGPLRKDIRSIATHIDAEIRKVILGSEVKETSDQMKSTVRERAVDTFMTELLKSTLGWRVEQVLRESEKNERVAVEVLSNYKSVLKEVYARYDVTYSPEEVSRFYVIIEPIYRLIEELRIIDDPENEHGSMFREKKELIVHDISDALSNASFRSYASYMTPEDIIRGLTDKFFDRDFNKDDPRHLVSAIAKVLSTIGIGNVKNQISSINFSAHEVLDVARDFAELCQIFIDVCLRQPEFELSRLGGEAGIREAAAKCEVRTFVTSRSPGELAAHHVTVALPYIGKNNLNVEVGSKKVIRRAVRMELQSEPIIASYRSRQPVIVNEVRYNAGYQIARIEKYHRFYKEISENHRQLYHVLLGADRFPDIGFDEAIVRPSGFGNGWSCQKHGEGDFEISGDELACPRCMDEYRRGFRRYMDVSRQSDDLELIVPGTEHWEEGPLVIPPILQGQFWNGPRDNERAYERGREGSFEGLLRDSRLASELPHSKRKDKKNDHRVFPAIFNEETNCWEWARRDPYPVGQFSMYQNTLEHFFECFHCGYPLPVPQDAERHLPQECPRCRRKVEHCHACSGATGFYFSPSEESKGGKKICPSCRNDMASSEDEDRADPDHSDHDDIYWAGVGPKKPWSSGDPGTQQGGQGGDGGSPDTPNDGAN